MLADTSSKEAETCLRLAENVSENLKLVTNEPVSGLYFVHKHVREKALRDMIRTKTKLLKHLSKLRQNLANVNADIGSTDIEESLRKGTAKTSEVASRIDALQERLETMINIEFEVQQLNSISPSGKGSDKSPSRSEKKSSKDRERDAKTPVTLPIGVGKRLDDMLMKGDLNIDDYVLKMSKLADDATESIGKN